MSRTARVATPTEGASRPTICVPVTFDGGTAFIAESIPKALADHTLPRTFSKEWCEQQGLKEEPGSAAVIRSFNGSSVALISLDSTYNKLEHYRLAGAAAVRVARDTNLAFYLPTDGIEEPGEAAQALVEGALLSAYRFKKADDVEATFDVVPLGSPLPSVETHDEVVDGVARGVVVAEGVNWAKRLIDTPPGNMTPKELAKQVAKYLKDDPNVRVDVWTESRIREERLGGLLGVGAGSAQPTRLVYATYRPKGEDLVHIVLVGKGVTFDSGGLSLKTGVGMMTMKTDMSGSAIVMTALAIASRLGLEVQVTAIAPMTENLPSDRATKPGDVLTIRNGMTIEVLNTDAEGRLILADGLSLAVEANPDAIVDVATLTGAQVVALGDEVGAMYATTEELADYFAGASSRSGEVLWRMPLAAGYESHLESDIADMKNIGKTGQAGSISAALLLQRFTDGRPWVHLDIAGPARAETGRGYVTKGATAFSTRTIVEFLSAVAAESNGLGDGDFFEDDDDDEVVVDVDVDTPIVEDVVLDDASERGAEGDVEVEGDAENEGDS
ncbi:MAG: leucyl aminopeptidase family protein [Acidimicrobiales bacterium]